MKYFIPILFLFGLFCNSQSIDQSEIYSIIKEIDSERIKNDIDVLANFGSDVTRIRVGLRAQHRINRNFKHWKR
jgi:hypothetical protein